MRAPTFLIVGTPRSGTTLVQRFASELEGVRVPPETHFFTEFAWVLHDRWRLPLEGSDLRSALVEYASRPYLRSVPFDADRVIAALDGRCRSALELYAAVVDHLAGDAAVVGEKTPGHLLWWRPLTSAWPRLKIVCVVRDPRAVVASHVQMGWSRHPVMTAQRWRDDVARVRQAAAALSPSRCLVLRYEDLLASEDHARAGLAAFLGVGVPPDPASSADPAALFAPWERWKAAALHPVDPARAEAWRTVLSATQVSVVEATCRAEMELIGYPIEMSSAEAIVRRVLLPPVAQARRLQHRLRRHRRERGISRIAARWSREAPG